MNLPLYGIERKKNLPELYEIATIPIKGNRIDTYHDMVNIMKRFLKMNTLAVEHVYVLCFLNDLTALGVGEIAIGSYGSSNVPIRTLGMFLALTGCEQFVVFHNHTNNYNIFPSQDDINITTQIESLANMFGIRFLEHIIISRSNWYMIKAGEKH